MAGPMDDSWKEIILAGMEIPLTGPLPHNNLATYPRRTVIGDPGLDANPLMSALVMSDFSGGNGVEEINEATDTTRFHISTFYTRFPKMTSKSYKATGAMTTATASTAWRFIGDLKVSSTWTAIVTGGTGGSANVVVYSLPYGGSPTSEGTLTAAPVNTSVRFKGTANFDKLFIPMGASGYATVEADTGFPFANNAADGTHPALIHACVHRYLLYGIDTAGRMWSTVDGSTWALSGATANMPTSELPRKLVSYFDRMGQPALFIVTDTRVWQFDDSGPNIFEVDWSFAPYMYNGNGATKWNGDLYVSKGMGVDRYTGGSVAPMGLNRDSGLPEDYLGYITDLVAGNNGLYAFVLADGGESSAIYEYNQNGWHMFWSSSLVGLDLVPHSAGISRAGDVHSLYFGATIGSATTQGIYRIDLPVADANPRNIAQISATSFDAGDFTMLTGIYDMAMRGTPKLGTTLDVTVTEIDATAVLRVYARTGGFDTSFNPTAADTYLLGRISTPGSHHLQLGSVDQYGINPGVLFEKIQFIFALTDTTNNPFFLESAVLAFVKMVAPSDSWQAQIDLSKNHAGNSPDVILQHIKSIMDNRVCVPMVYRGVTHRVMISQMSGTSETGSDERSFITLSLLEIPDGLDFDG